MTPLDFWSNVNRTEGCWLWTRAEIGNGYGAYRRRGAHRASWEMHFGPIPDGLWVLHHCDNRRCVRPDHLFLGTHADNMADMARKGRAVWGERQHRKLSAEQVREIRSSKEIGRALAARFGVSQPLISMIRTRRVWAHLPEAVA